MTERTGIHGDLGAYLLGALDAAERDRFVQHLAGCERCRATAAELEGTLGLLARSAAPVAPPADLEERTLGAIRAGAGRAQATRPPQRRRRRLEWRRLALAGGLAVALGVAVLAGVRLGEEGGLPGTPELEATLRSPSGAVASADVRKTGIGRVVELRTDDLPILPEGGYYELWFVGPGDRPDAPNRISAGTFHPDQNGRSHVRFAAAVDPAKYPGLAVTREPGDGDPAPSRPDVLRSRP